MSCQRHVNHLSRRVQGDGLQLELSLRSVSQGFGFLASPPLCDQGGDGVGILITLFVILHGD